MAFLPVVDRLVDRAIVARIGQTIDAGLTDRMCASRLATTAQAWSLRGFSHAYQAYQNGRLESLEQKAWPYTLITDLRGFYPSIRRDLLTGELRARHCDAEAVATLGERLAVWQHRDGLHGLPSARASMHGAWARDLGFPKRHAGGCMIPPRRATARGRKWSPHLPFTRFLILPATWPSQR